MNLNELHSFKLSDAIKFHKELNPKIWKNDQLDPLVKKQLLVIAEDFVEELGIADLDVVDITISGSNAAYTYTKHSDLDLHILVNMSELHQDAIYRELFRAKKTLYNDTHDITVHGIPVELYVQDSAEPVVSLGEYSILHDKWIKVPVRRTANLDQNATKAKFEQLKDLIDVALKTKHSKKISKALALIRRYRQAGLDKGGEFSPENLAYKAARSQGAIDALYAMRDQLHSAELTIEDGSQLEENDMLAEELRKEFEGYSGPRGKSSSPIGQVKTLTARDIKGKYTDEQLIALGFKKDLNGNFTIPLLKWNKLRSTKQVEDYDPNGKPPGPEFKPTMPAGTVKVGVSDVYDWYKLGQHVSNLKGLGKHDFGKGPPSTILSFGDEETEHKYIQDLEKTGLTTTDIDPLDRKQPKNMKRQKTDPTYNVDSYAEDLDEDFEWQDDPRCWHGDDKDTTPYQGLLKKRVKMSLPGVYPEGHKYFIQVFYKNSPTTAVLVYTRNSSDVGRMQREIDFDAHARGEVPETFWWGDMTLTAEEAFNLHQCQRRGLKKAPKKQNITWTPVDEALDSQPYPYEEIPAEYKSQKLFRFKTDKDLTYLVSLHDFQGRLGISFALQKSKFRLSTEIEDTGDARKVFATVIEIVKKYVNATKPVQINFTADEPSRMRLYDAFIKRLDRELPDYTGRQDGEGWYMLKRKTEDLDEALDSQPYPYRSIPSAPYTYEYAFTTDDNNEYEVTIMDQKFGGHVSFHLKQKQKDGKIKSSTGITGTGDARKVFATVIDIVKKYAATKKPEAIVFTASEPSRIRLYDAFVKRLDKELPDYAETRKEKGMAEWFILLRKTEKLDESAERDVAGDMLKAEWDRFKGGIKDKVSNVVLGPTFKKKMFETVLDYHRFLLCPKDGTDNLHNCRRHPLKQYSTLNEDTVASREARTFADTIMSIGSPIEIVEGGKLALIHTMAMPDNKIIDIYGFTNPKTIEKIHYEDNGEIEYIQFDNGDTYPDQGELVNIGGTNITNTIMFNDKSKAETAYTKLWFTINKMEGLGWKVKSALVETAKINEDEDWHTDPMKWHGGRDDPDWYDMYKTEPLKVKVRLWRGTGTYTVRNFEKISPTKAEITYKRDGMLGTQRIDFDNISTYRDRQGYSNDDFSFYCGSMPITARQAFNLFQTKLHTPQTKAPKQKITWTPVDESLNETRMSDVVQPLIREFNLEHGGSERWSNIVPLHTVSSTKRWRRGDGSYYTDPNRIEAFDQNNPAQRQLQSEFYDWLIQKPGVGSGGEISGEFRSSGYSEAAKYKGVIFVKRGTTTEYFTPSKLRNSSVWNKKNDNDLEKPPKKDPKQKQNITWTPVDEALDSTPYPYEIIEDNSEFQTSEFWNEKDNRYIVGIEKHVLGITVEFSLDDDNRPGLDQGITGTGDARKVFATVIEIIKNYTNEHKPSKIFFSSTRKEPSRVRLYQALAKRADRALPDYTFKPSPQYPNIFTLVLKSENLDEALDSQPYPYQIEEDSVAWQISTFKTNDDNKYKVWISKFSNKEANVEFAYIGDDDVDDINSTGIRHIGDARKVFATVIEIVKKYANKYKPNTITFSSDADEPSRIRLYNALVKRADRVMPDYRDVSGESIGSWSNWYTLARKGFQFNEASGYIPSKKEANDPRFKTALTVDVKPDSIQKNAKAFGSKTSRAGIPPTARADGKIK